MSDSKGKRRPRFPTSGTASPVKSTAYTLYDSGRIPIVPAPIKAPGIWRGTETVPQLCRSKERFINHMRRSGNCLSNGMVIGPIASLAGGLVQSIVSKAFSHSSSAKTSSAATAANSVSPFAQILGSLQEPQHSNPAQHAQVLNRLSPARRSSP